MLYLHVHLHSRKGHQITLCDGCEHILQLLGSELRTSRRADRSHNLRAISLALASFLKLLNCIVSSRPTHHLVLSTSLLLKLTSSLLEIYMLSFIYVSMCFWVSICHKCVGMEFPPEHSQYFNDTLVPKLGPKDMESCAHLCAVS